MKSPYLEQARLMLRILPHVAKETCFALKGGSAINFFRRDMPRISVDIDLTYVPISPRDEALGGIGEALQRIKAGIGKAIPGAAIHESLSAGHLFKLVVRGDGAQVKIEPNTVIRGTIEPPVERALSAKVENKFGLAVLARIAADSDLYGGKICAALDRQHPRDLFDVKLLLAGEGLTAGIRKGFVVYLASHDRPMHELIDPSRKDMRAVYDSEFLGMTDEPVTYEELVETRERLIVRLRADLTDAERKFLVSIKEGQPDWDLMGLPGIENMPAIQWKLQNIRKMNKTKHRDQLFELKSKLGL
ncbi:MAG: nucleotidyl transferase AbiEii/AbiGii toxin family protein [Elusimicrobia bacterium]|nr:nucleotidyl transferase AbiEii/AbiGii toxin family protein [Elusimicrobiota bacterium]